MTSKFGNAGALGLSAFGVTTFCLMMHNTGFMGMSTMIFAMGMFYGGVIQVIVGIMEWKMGNTFGTVAFSSYGAFWLAFSFMEIMPMVGLGAAPDGKSVGVFMVAWTIFTIFMFISTLKIIRILQVVFGIACIGFPLLAIHAFTGDSTIGTVAAYIGIILALAALYGGQAQIVNEVYGKEVLPIGMAAAARKKEGA